MAWGPAGGARTEIRGGTAGIGTEPSARAELRGGPPDDGVVDGGATAAGTGAGGDHVGDGGSARPGSAGRAGVLPDSVAARTTRVAVRAVIAVAAGVMAAGFLDWRAGVLVTVLVALGYLLLHARPRGRSAQPHRVGRWLRVLRRHGYHLLTDGATRHVAVGPGGVYLLETRFWRDPLTLIDDEWRIGGVPAVRVVDRLVRRAARIAETLRRGGAADHPVVPVLMVAGRLPEPVMRSGGAVIAGVASAVGYIATRPSVVDPRRAAEIATVADGGTVRP
ncbi:hypothetical protein [Marinactinospora rubrisoli]|uniref:NERD domain-containing protein n=1 Tax=Marinactinospora rubrisoli TaxID=2715399 RepID=A0ABW2KIT4_9ACTN